MALTNGASRCKNEAGKCRIFCHQHRWWGRITLLGIVWGVFVALPSIGADISQMYGITFTYPFRQSATALTTAPAMTIAVTPSPVDTIFTPTKALSFTATHTIIPTATWLPTPISSSTPVFVNERRFCANFNLNVRKGPDENHSPVIGGLPIDACLLFDARIPDNSWVRVALGQEEKYKSIEGGWVKSENLRPQLFGDLQVYIPKDATNGLYCVNTFSGVYIREDPDKDSRWTGKLLMDDCLYFDGRTEDNSWLRISSNQDNAKYLVYAGNWIMSEFLILKSYPKLIYLEYLPVVTPVPTPQG